MSFLAAAYPWIKTAHIVSVVAWMAGLLYLPRLFVYHAASRAGSEQSETFKMMERRLYRGIMNPAMVGTYLFGILLAGTPGIVDWTRGWIWVKLGAVVALTVFHLLCGRWRGEFARDGNRHPQRFFRFINEVPTLLLILAVAMAVAKPF
jgi:protoporphyrinogen IX oxidase